MPNKFMIQFVFRRLRFWGAFALRAVAATLFLACPALANQGTGSTGSILNILLLGLVAYFVVRAFRRRSGRDDRTRPGSWTQDRPEDSAPGETKQDRTLDRHDVARQMWEMLGSKPDESQPREAGEARPARPVPGGFDQAEFLEGAKLFFSRFQQIVDRSDLDELHGFLSESVYREALDRLQSSGGERTEVMLVDARVLETKTEGGRTSVSVHYDAQLRRGASGERAEQVRSVWEFSRDDSAENGLWTLEKINTMTQ